MVHKIVKEGKRKVDYVVINDTYYDCNEEMANRLERIRESGQRVRFHWGDTKTGKDWGDVYDVAGRIGRSTGTRPIPLLINNRRSYGGGALLCSSIVKITTTKKPKFTLYEHPKYHTK